MCEYQPSDISGKGLGGNQLHNQGCVLALGHISHSLLCQNSSSIINLVIFIVLAEGSFYHGSPIWVCNFAVSFGSAS